MDKNGDLQYQEKVIKEVSAQLYVAGSDTTVSALETLFLGLLCYPEVQKKAHAELDRVLKGRIPTFEDKENLPYITACMKETFRWNPVTPVCIPHCTITEDVYRNWRIPKNATVVPNAWAMLHNEKVYPEPYEFKPERWLDANGKLLDTKAIPDPWVMFGFGRRTCPGQFVPTNSVWMTCASVLAMYSIEKPLDEFGKPVEIDHRHAFTSALTVHTIPYKAIFKPRSADAERQIRNIAKAAANN
jgi:cytochrome P450